MVLAPFQSRLKADDRLKAEEKEDHKPSAFSLNAFSLQPISLRSKPLQPIYLHYEYKAKSLSTISRISSSKEVIGCQPRVLSALE